MPQYIFLLLLSFIASPLYASEVGSTAQPKNEPLEEALTQYHKIKNKVPVEKQPLPSLFKDAFKDSVIIATIQDFWNNAVDSNGHKLVPYNDYEKTHSLLETEQAYNVIDQGYFAGMLRWCGLDDKEYLHQSQNWGKTNYQWNVKRAAFATRLFSISRDFTIANTKKLQNTCNDITKSRLQASVKQSLTAVTP